MKKRVARRRTIARRAVKVSRKKSAHKVKGSVLSGAMRDLQTEIRKLSKEKASNKRSLSSVTSAVEVDRKQERALQQKIAKLIEREARLNQRKKSLQTRIDRDSDKINKIAKIKSEMGDI